jgi:bacteriocin biosynthesis cyclodehydratase domain-containing protein
MAAIASSRAVVLRPSPAWTLTEQEGSLLVSGGADALYLVATPSAGVASELVAAWRRGVLDRTALSADAGRVLDVLVSARVVELHIEAPARSVAYRFIGEPHPAFSAASDAESASLLVIVRTNGQLSQLTAMLPDQPHLLVDLAYNHTISFGPLVFPGETACLGCLAGRIAAAWGDAAPPARPAVLESPELIAGLTAIHVSQAFEGTSQLINQTLAYDLQEHEVKRDRVYKLPHCPRCGELEPASGAIELLWAARR